jgi:glycosyltransferase involved in cell wall biosynthesis
MQTVTVITSSIGRPELRQTIESVRSQTYKGGDIRHYVFVNGPRFHESAREVLKDYPSVHAFYLPEETGDYGYGTREKPRGGMADVFAGAPFLTRSDWIFYLDDDNFYEPNHIESVMKLAETHDLKWAYSLRKIVDQKGEYICDDDWCSLGHYKVQRTVDEFLVDNSCFAVSRRLAQTKSLAWTAMPHIADRCFLAALKESGEKYGCTGLSTVNYRVGTGTAPTDREMYLDSARQIAIDYPNGFPWRTPQVWNE